MIRKITKVGNTAKICLPVKELRYFNWKQGEVLLDIDNEKIIITKPKPY